jgi:hypothetical protein
MASQSTEQVIPQSRNTGENDGWTQSPRWIPLTYAIGLLPLLLLLNLRNTFHIDWKNHLWMISYVGEYIRQHWALPIVLNTDQMAGMPYPVFYGYIFYPIAGAISTITGGNMAMRLVCAAVFALQLTQVRRTFEMLTGNRFIAFAVAILVSFGTYPLTNLYNRAAIPEFVATSLIVCVLMMCVRLPYVSPGRGRVLLLVRAGLLFALAFGTHPITAVLGSLVVMGVLAVTVFRLEARGTIWKSLAVIAVLLVCVGSPWVYALRQFNHGLYVNETAGKVSVFANSIGRLAVRLCPLPYDPRIGTPEVVALGSPFLDAQVNVPLALLALLLIAVTATRRRERTRFEFYAAVAAMLASAVLVLVSVSQGFWNRIPVRLSFLQFGYRLITYIDICFLIAVACLAARALKGRPELTRPILAGVALCLGIATTGMALKLAHANAIQRIDLLPGSELGTANRDALLTLPSTFYGAKAYAIRLGTAGVVPTQSGAAFPIGRGRSFGVIGSVPISAAQPLVVRTNLQVFPWNHIAVNGAAIPFGNLHEDPEVNVAVPVSAGSSTLSYDLRPGRLWTALRFLSLCVVFLWSIAAISVRTAPVAIGPSPVPQPTITPTWTPIAKPALSGTFWSRTAAHTGLIALIALALCVEFTVFLQSSGFGPEFTEFYGWMHAKPFHYVVVHYEQFNVGWYRPTQFFLPYWIADHFVSWQNPSSWRALELATVLAVCAFTYALVLLLLPGRRGAAFAAALYFTCVPSLFIPLYELAGFDFLHIVFTIAAVMAYIKGFRARWLGWTLWTIASWVLFVIALTCKEITIITPLYLAYVSAVLLWWYTPPDSRRRRALAETARLVPFFAMVPVYWVIHMLKLPPGFASSGDYRKGFDFERVFENVEKYPLWLTRVYALTTDTLKQTTGYEHWWDDLAGWALLAAVIIVSRWLWKRSVEYRPFILLALGWIVIFLAIPIYSGGYVWHGNLALVGYCMLVGVAVDTLVRLAPRRAVRAGLTCILVLIVIGLTRVDADEWLLTGVHADAYRLNSSLLERLPVPRDRLRGPALVYVEDRKNLGEWWYGVGTLFNLAYENEDLEQVVVPPMRLISAGARDRWLKTPNAFFFRYDDHFRWRDATEEFRTYMLSHPADAVDVPQIKALEPPATRPGLAFNPQPDGSSAISVRGTGFAKASQIVFGKRPLDTAFGSSEWITATVPKAMYANPTDIPVYVKNADGAVSNQVHFLVAK